MATPTDFPQANFTFTTPVNMTKEQCGDLPVYKGIDTHGSPIIISCWQLSPEELEAIKTTGKVYLTVVGEGTPPIGIQVLPPFI